MGSHWNTKARGVRIYSIRVAETERVHTRITQGSILTFPRGYRRQFWCDRERNKAGEWRSAWESRRAAGPIAGAPKLSCLYKQALIFLSTAATFTIYSLALWWDPEGPRNSVTVHAPLRQM